MPERKPRLDDCGWMTVGLYRNAPLKIAQGGRPASGSGSDRAVRRKPVVRSGQDVWGYGFSIASMIGVASEKRHR
jgi:hypothetical protein